MPFSEKRSFIAQQHIPSGERPCAFAICSKGLGVHNNLITHQCIPISEQSYASDVCVISHSVRQAVLQHMNTYIGGRIHLHVKYVFRHLINSVV